MGGRRVVGQVCCSAYSCRMALGYFKDSGIAELHHQVTAVDDVLEKVE